MLDTVGLIWSSFEATSGIGLSEQRCLHTAISVTGVETEDGCSDEDNQHQEETESQPPSSPIEGAAVGDATAPVPAVQLWGPVAMGAAQSAPGTARSTGSEKGAVAAAAAGKKKNGAKEGSAGSKKAGTKDVVKSGPAGGNCGDGSDPDTYGGTPPVFESVLVFGGIVGNATVSGVSSPWRGITWCGTTTAEGVRRVR